MRFDPIDWPRLAAVAALGLAAGCVQTSADDQRRQGQNGEANVYRIAEPAYDFSRIGVLETVVYVLDLPHFSLPDENSRAAIARLKEEPEALKRAIAAEISPAEALGGEERQSMERVENAIQLLGAVGDPVTDDLLGEWYGELESRFPPIGETGMSDATRLRNLIMNATRGRYVPVIFDDLVSAWPVSSESERRQAINYLFAAASNSPAAAGALRRFAASGAPGTDHPLIAQAIARL